MYTTTAPRAPGNGEEPHVRYCHGRCGKQILVPRDPRYQHRILLCEDCWTALESVLVHLVKVVSAVS